MATNRRLLIGTGTILGGAAVVGGALGIVARAMLRRQAAVARGLIGKPLGEDAPVADRVFKKSYGRRVELVVLGDSIAAGLGAELPDKTLGARLAKGIAKQAHRSVRLTTLARVGSETSGLADQLAQCRGGCGRVDDCAARAPRGSPPPPDRGQSHPYMSARCIGTTSSSIQTLSGPPSGSGSVPVTRKPRDA